MGIYVILVKFTAEGIKNIRSLRQFVEGNRQSGAKLGINVKGWYLTQGQYDAVIILEAPDDQSVAAQTLKVAERGMSRPETLRAFTLDEAEQIFQKMG